MPLMCRAGEANPRVYTTALYTLYRQWKHYKDVRNEHPRKGDVLYQRYLAMRDMFVPLLNNFWVCAFPYIPHSEGYPVTHWFTIPMIDAGDIQQLIQERLGDLRIADIDDRKLLDILRSHMEQRGFKNLPPFK